MSSSPLPLDTDLAIWQNKQIFDSLPVPTAILNAEYQIVCANKRFTQTFGPWEGRRCWEVYHKTNGFCGHKSCAKTFENAAPTVSKGQGVTQSGQHISYTKYSIPLFAADGTVPYIIEMCMDNTSADILRGEYQSLFDLVPCSIVIINKDLRIIDSNQAVRDIYGELDGKNCYAVLKGQEGACANCIAKKAFLSKAPQVDTQIWLTPEGELCHYQVTAVPIKDENDKVTAIMEMAVDITELTYLRDQSELKNLMLASIVGNSLRGIAVISDDGEIPILNPALTKLLDLPAIGISGPEELYNLLPEQALEAIRSGRDHFRFSELSLFPERGEDAIPIILEGSRLRHGVKSLGLLLAFQDLREIKSLERAKVEAERMAAVGQTVSGLAHGIKNLVTALEGGMYMLTSGMQGGKVDRITQGVDMLQRNIDRIGSFVKNFLHFARGRRIKASMGDPASVAAEVAEQYRVKAQQNGIAMDLDMQPDVEQASIDYESLHDSLTNLVGNAIDACVMTEEGKDTAITVGFREKDGVLIYEVKDTGCGMDDNTRKKVFSRFFTTKGENGTGIGLLMTKKIIQEHGGYLELDSELGKGTTFRICLPRKNLPKPEQEVGEGQE